ncbi:MAG: hypothetical protein GEU79_03580 [Acidimicrobiia bacterium]|nr:hypothetical protein [Acidimicrobiia bacterium]
MRRSFSLLVVVVMLGSLMVPVAASSFDDVPDDHLFAEDIEWLAESGITRGCNPPDNTVSVPTIR